VFGELQWWGYVLLAALPGIGFAVGVRWMSWHTRLKQQEAQNRRTPLPASDGFETQIVGAVDSMQRQLEELAERQDFAERLLAQRQLTPPPKQEKVPTPV